VIRLRAGRLGLLGVFLVLSACLQAETREEPEKADWSGISDKARAALPDHTGPEDVLRDNTGCYAIFDRGDNWVRPLLNAEGDQICD